MFVELNVCLVLDLLVDVVLNCNFLPIERHLELTIISEHNFSGSFNF